MITVHSIYIYPVKSCRGIQVRSAAVNDYGFELDRFWTVATSAGAMVTQRTVPRMALISTKLVLEGHSHAELHDIPAHAYQHGGKLVLSAPGMPDFTIPFRSEDEMTVGEHRQVEVWESQVDGFDEGDRVATWLSEFLGRDVRLVVKDVTKVRDLPRKHTPAKSVFKYDPQTAFADGFPFLLASQPSLDDLNSRLTAKALSPVSMLNFRPNIVIDYAELPAFTEDTFLRIEIGGHQIIIASRCSRCRLPNNDPETGNPHKTEPLVTLMGYRRLDKIKRHKAFFGVNCIQTDVNWTMHTGDEVRVLQKGQHDERGVWRGNATPGMLPEPSTVSQDIGIVAISHSSWQTYWNMLLSWWSDSLLSRWLPL
ncbi:hypothetical protein HDU85_005570 [Gaertneriomyces sp. JEL0708]|nr:hypothetical protein HDU85_005570 [Gaertneriomyces sp. JEL0708]